MLTRALMDSHYGKPNVIARAFREPRTAAVAGDNYDERCTSTRMSG